MRANMFEYMDIFVQVVEQGSFTRAADVLQLHRPAVSKTIQQLEDELGVKLLHRTTRKLSLTAEGEEFYQRAKVLLTEMSDVIASFSPTLPPKGKLRLDAPLSLAHTILIPHLTDFQARYPDIEIVLTSSDRKTDLIAEGVDCVIRLGELADSSFIAKRLGHARMVTCASPDYISRQGMPRTPEELAGHKAVNFFSEHSREVMEWRFNYHGEIFSQKMRGGMVVDNSDILLSAGLSGLGIIQALHIALKPYIQSGQLIEVLPEYVPVPKPISVLYPDRRYLSPKVRVFIDWVSQLFLQHQI